MSMDGTNRLATSIVLAGVIGLTVLMAYTLGLGTGPGWSFPSGDPKAEVAVVFPDHDDWMDFRQGFVACEARGLGVIEDETPDAVVMRTEPGGRLVRFRWARASGAIETREVIEGLVSEAGTAPVAVVGSINTALTVELAEALAARPNGPALLVPWATADHASGASITRTEGAEGEPTLLGLHPGRAFRFAPSNHRLAEEVVRIAGQGGDQRPPGRVVVVIDRNDPYAIDLAREFEGAIARAWPALGVSRLEGEGPSPGLSDEPGPSEVEAARRLWDLAREAVSVPTWVVLPLQAEPTRRMVRALSAQVAAAPSDGPRPDLKVICGDGIGPDSLDRLGPSLPFGVWCVSTDLAIGQGADLPRDAQVPAEIVAALLHLIDEASGPITADTVVAGLRSLDIAAGERSAFGRPLAFDASGERREGALGLVLERPPGSREVLAFRPSLADAAASRRREGDEPPGGRGASRAGERFGR
jgi:hypothetical protein